MAGCILWSVSVTLMVVLVLGSALGEEKGECGHSLLCCCIYSYIGALDGGSPMSRVEFKKWSCRMSLSYSCPMSPLIYCHVACRI